MYLNARPALREIGDPGRSSLRDVKSEVPRQDLMAARARKGKHTLPAPAIGFETLVSRIQTSPAVQGAITTAGDPFGTSDISGAPNIGFPHPRACPYIRGSTSVNYSVPAGSGWVAALWHCGTLHTDSNAPSLSIFYGVPAASALTLSITYGAATGETDTELTTALHDLLIECQIKATLGLRALFLPASTTTAGVESRAVALTQEQAADMMAGNGDPKDLWDSPDASRVLPNGGIARLPIRKVLTINDNASGSWADNEEIPALLIMLKGTMGGELVDISMGMFAQAIKSSGSTGWILSPKTAPCLEPDAEEIFYLWCQYHFFTEPFTIDLLKALAEAVKLIQSGAKAIAPATTAVALGAGAAAAVAPEYLAGPAAIAGIADAVVQAIAASPDIKGKAKVRPKQRRRGGK